MPRTGDEYCSSGGEGSFRVIVLLKSEVVTRPFSKNSFGKKEETVTVLTGTGPKSPGISPFSTQAVSSLSVRWRCSVHSSEWVSKPKAMSITAGPNVFKEMSPANRALASILNTVASDFDPSSCLCIIVANIQTGFSYGTIIGFVMRAIVLKVTIVTANGQKIAVKGKSFPCARLSRHEL